jgi:hypothetical protein
MNTDISYILSVFMGLYIIHYAPNINLLFFLSRFYHKAFFFFKNHYNNIKLYENLIENYNNDNKEESAKVEKNYEEKYLDEIRNLNKEFVFDDNEENLRFKKYVDLVDTKNESYSNRINEINTELLLYDNKLVKYESIDNDYEYDGEDSDSDYDLCRTKEERINFIKREKNKLIAEMEILKDNLESKEGQENIMNQAKEDAHKFIVDKRLEKLNNCFIIEHTPLGNVLMIYDNERESFKYYSDNNIPYRYLEVVARKYVKQFHCRPIFVDMEKELKMASEKWEKEREEKELKEKQEKERKEVAIKNQTVVVEQKKNVFAKFKQYNKTAGTGHVNSAAPPKNSIPNKGLTEKQENEKILLKEKANRYTYEGKFANFNFLKKVDKKAVNKKMALTFADFKKMQKTK